MTKKISVVLSLMFILLAYLLIGGYIYTGKNKDSSKQGIAKLASGDFEFTFQTEPIDLPAKPEEGAYSPYEYYPEMNSLEITEDTWITEIIPQIENAPSTVIHHGAIYMENIYDEQCTSVNKMFYSASQEMTGGTTPSGYGFFIPKGTIIKSSKQWMHFRNDTSINYENVIYKVLIKGTQDPSKNLKKLDVLWINQECSAIDEFIFPVPPNKNFVKTMSPFIAPYDFKFIIVSAHIHDYGNKFELLRNGDVIWTSIPQTDGPRVTKIPIEYPNPPIEVKKGDKLEIKTYYENTTGQILEGMGIFGSLIEITGEPI